MSNHSKNHFHVNLNLNVAILPGSDFGRDPQEFSARIAYVDFNGREAMEASEVLFNEEKNYDLFVETYCPMVATAVKRLGEWLAR